MAEAISFYFDENVPHTVARGMRGRGVDVLTAQEAGQTGASDADQLAFATARGRVLMTHDSDFLELAASGVQHAGITFCYSTKYPPGPLIQALLIVRGVMDCDDMRNQVEYL